MESETSDFQGHATCSTPFGIKEFFIKIDRDTLALIDTCSTPFGIKEFFIAPH